MACRVRDNSNIEDVIELIAEQGFQGLGLHCDCFNQ